MAILARTLFATVFILAYLMLFRPEAHAQFADASAETDAAAGDSAGDEETTLLTADELNTLVAPVALYPDELLSIVLPASTNPIQIVEAQRFLDQKAANPDLKPDENWDPSVLALLNYPEVVKKMNDDLSWTQDLGSAVMDQQADVMNAIQAARGSANDAGYLESNDQQTVTVNDNDKIVIQSAQPDVVYVPQYDPAPIVNNTYVNYPPPVYSDPYPPYWGPGATFFAGAVVGATFAYAFDWNDNDIDIDCCGGGGDIDIDNDINVNRGDINIGSGNTNIDRSKVKDKFNGDRKAGSDGKMKWSAQKARQKSDLPRKNKAARANRPDSAAIKQQLGSGGQGIQQGAGKANRVKNNKASRAQSQRGQKSLNQTKKPKQQLRQNASNKQQASQNQQRPQKQLQKRQTKQKQGGAFQNQHQPQKQVNRQSSRGNKSLNKGGHSKPQKPRRRN